MCTRVGNQRSRGVVIAWLRSSVRSLLHQRRDLHQSTYLYLVEDRKPTSHHNPNGFTRRCAPAVDVLRMREEMG
jgi:hypothetical protein